MIRYTSVVFPAPAGPTIATVCPGSATRDSEEISGLSGEYEKDMSSNTSHPRPKPWEEETPPAGSGNSSSSSNNENTRSADATSDCSRFAMDPSCASGMVNCAPKLGAFPARLLLRISFGPVAQFRTMASRSSGSTAVTAGLISELLTWGRSEAGCCSHPASLVLT
ncbi:UNVERIFIED_ORG: hypothetical protein ABIB19_002157 [Arthrobacter sp. UYEF10]